MKQRPPIHTRSLPTLPFLPSLVLALALGSAPASADLLYDVAPPGSEPAAAAASDGWDGPGTGSITLTYYIGEMTADLAEDEVVGALLAAMGVWSEVADITFVEVATPGLADSIDIYFATGDHGDGAPFSGGVLAHAFFPGDYALAGDVHFNDAFSWEVGDTPGGDASYDLLWVAVHELGHSLGLDHSSVSGAVMFPSVGSETAFSGLHDDDIASILSIYAPATSVPEPGALALMLAAVVAGALHRASRDRCGG